MEEKIDKLIRLVNQLNDKVEELSSDIKEIKKKLEEGAAAQTTVKPSDVEWKEKHPETVENEESPGRIKCPKCGAVGNDIGKKEDKSRVITYMGGVPVYAQKYYCKKCMHEWSA